jgi:hypothetical protein
MNLEQIVKETVAKIVAEKELTAAEKKKKEDIVMAMKKDFKGPKSSMYAIATDKAKKLAEDGFFNPTDQNHQKAAVEISNFLLKNIPQYMSAQDAGKLLKYMGNELENDSNWQQALSYYSKVVNEDKLNEDYDFVKSSIESASGDKISHTEEDDYGRTVYWSTKNPNVNYFVGQGGEFEGKIYLYNGETGERYPIGDLKHYGDGQNHSADDDMHEQQELEEFMIRRWQYYAGIK